MSTSKHRLASESKLPQTADAPQSIAFPEALAEQPADKLAMTLQSHLVAALQLLERFVHSRPTADQSAWAKQLGCLQTTLRMVHKEYPSEALPPDMASGDGALEPERVQEFGVRVANARKAAGLTRPALARLAGLSEKTIWNVENGKIIPTHATVLRLLFVKELGLTSEQVPWQQKGALDFGAAPNCWIAPGYEPLKMFTDLFEVLNGPGGSVEQTFVYLDHQSAVNWYSLCNQSFYAAKYRARVPLDAMARRILEFARHGRLDVMALGSGDGKQETRLVEHLLNWADESRRAADVRLFLLDVSQPLLSAAYQHAAQTLGKRAGVGVQAIQGDFHQWPRYTQLHHSAERGHRRRLISLIGLTIGNLENEARFFQHTLVGLAPDDLLLLDCLVAVDDPARPDAIRRKDPALLNGPSPEHRAWLSGPLWRYCQDVQDVELQYSLAIPCTVPGSYGIDVVAKVHLREGQHKRFALFRFKRYDPDRLAEVMRHLGWELLDSATYGPEGPTPFAALLLFRKLSPSRILE
jgi:transcriptional regulator with XRE-family HTH domain